MAALVGAGATRRAARTPRIAPVPTRRQRNGMAPQRWCQGGATPMKLSSRFVLDNLFVIAAGFLAVATMAWSIGVAHWVAFAVSVGVLLLAGLSAVLAPTLARKAGHGGVGLAAAWSIIAALVFSCTALTWLVFADALLIRVLAL